ncbi:hypothetical protein QBC47DRAFT_212518 [Echria macrotheca]|uniref:Uncharacterized protein n=1 Tax=Echria macrotheca TaxID=438768 RepID=A0AAJ0FBD8_9PEZI|nr:hypothetical protein QBC47DRAFT_212518 [Echria macrotheca]
MPWMQARRVSSPTDSRGGDVTVSGDSLGLCTRIQILPALGPTLLLHYSAIGEVVGCRDGATQEKKRRQQRYWTSSRAETDGTNPLGALWHTVTVTRRHTSGWFMEYTQRYRYFGGYAAPKYRLDLSLSRGLVVVRRLDMVRKTKSNLDTGGGDGRRTATWREYLACVGAVNCFGDESEGCWGCLGRQRELGAKGRIVLHGA